jgi:cobalt transporter subunit CbtB
MRSLAEAHIKPAESVFTNTTVQLVGAFVLGVVVMFGVGFLPMDVAHNAAHDTRHSFAFPCH